MSAVQVQLVVALTAEARPLRESFNLRRRPGSAPFPLFENLNMRMIVSGVGKLAAAAATGCLQAQSADRRPSVWLNVGIAGHGSLPVGSPFMASEVLDQGSGRIWRPFFAAAPPCSLIPLTTVDRPPEEYPGGRAVDMEAAGYFAAALRNAPEELVHCVKVVSDNSLDSRREISGEKAGKLVAGQIDTLVHIIDGLTGTATRLALSQPSPASVKRLADRLSLNRSDRRRLARLLTRWKLLDPSSDLWLEAFANQSDGKEMLASLDRHLTALAQGISARPNQQHDRV